MFGVSSCTTYGTVGEFVTRSMSAFSRRRPGSQSMWLYSGLEGMIGLPRNGPAMRSVASRTASRRSPVRALRTMRKPSRSKVSRCSCVSFTKSMASLPDHTAVLHLAVHRRPELGVREQRLHRFLRIERVIAALLLDGDFADVVALELEL